MTLLIAVFAAVIATAVWYVKPDASRHKVGLLVWMELKAEYFTPEPADMLNDAFLGLSVVALALVVWIIVLLVKDPDGRVRDALRRKK